MTDDTLAARIERLEIRIAYQDETIETLNQTITGQWREIDRLTRLLARFEDRLREAESRPAGPPQAEPPPPHY